MNILSIVIQHIEFKKTYVI